VGREEDAPVSSEEEKNMALVRRFQEAEANADLDMLDELLAPDFVDHSLLEGQEPGREGYKRQLAEQHAALSDVRCTIEDQIAKGDKVVPVSPCAASTIEGCTVVSPLGTRR
jgi:ketosteroid isomerase-like protein